MIIRVSLAFIFAAGLVPEAEGGLPDAPAPRPNILFIAVDDLRSQLGCYGYEDMVTPNIDRLAAQGVVFRNHYVTNPICIPSRAGMLTGTRSERTRQVYGKMVWQTIEGVQPMGRTFADAGYQTISLGKIWHFHSNSEKNLDSFHVQWNPAKTGLYADASILATLRRDGKSRVPAVEGPLDVADDAYSDGQIAERAVSELKTAVGRENPFLLMVGFHKPHLPYNAPQKYWDLYDTENPPGQPERPVLPEGAPELAARPRHELWTYSEDFSLEQPPTGAAAQRLRHAYAACVSYVDAQIGKVLTALDELGLAGNTIVVLWSDHGYHLGHLGQWTKHTNFETAAGAPLIISAPGYRAGGVCRLPVESVDLFPTLLDLTGLPPLRVTDGESLRPLLEDPSSSEWQGSAYHVVDRTITTESGTKRQVIGRALRTLRYRYVEWRMGWGREAELLATELYDFSSGASGESVNLANDPQRRDVVEQLSVQLWNWSERSSSRPSAVSSNVAGSNSQ